MQIANNNVDSFNNNIKGKKENEDGLYTSFIYSIRSEVTRQIYVRCLKYYMKFLGINNLGELVEGKPQKIIESDIKAYLVYLRKQKKVSYNTKSLYLAAIRKFYYVNSDYQFKWNLITMYLGSDDDVLK
jgi:site-specific recombinase XerD